MPYDNGRSSDALWYTPPSPAITLPRVSLQHVPGYVPPPNDDQRPKRKVRYVPLPCCDSPKQQKGRARWRRYYARHRERILERDRQRRKTPEYRAHAAAWQRQRYAKMKMKSARWDTPLPNAGEAASIISPE